MSNSLDRINQLKAEIASLEQEAVSELHQRRASMVADLERLDAEIARITGKAPRAAKGRSRAGRSVSLQELKEMLERSHDKTVNVRKEKLDFSNIKTLAHANPHLLKLGGKGPWPTVTLLK